MSSFMCCNPIHVDDEEIDMELEQVWDLQRKRSNGGRGPSTARKGRINFLNRGNRRGFSLSRNKPERPMSQNSQNSQNRTMSTGRPRQRSRSLFRGRSKDRDADSSTRSRSPWGRRKMERQVSISKYVEKIETRPRSRGMSRGRTGNAAPIMGGRGRSRGPSQERRTRTTGIGKSRSRSRSWSLGRRKKDRQAKKDDFGRYGAGIVRVKSRDQSNQQRKNRFDDHSVPSRKKSGLFRRRQSREPDYDEDEWSSSCSSEESDNRGGGGGFFGGFR